MKESKRVGEWKFRDSDLAVPPEILIEQKRDDPVIQALLGGGDARGTAAASLLRSKLAILLGDDSRRQRDKRKMIRDLRSAGVEKRALAEATLRGCRDVVFRRKVRRATCDPFPPELAVLVDLSFFPDEFFSPTSQPEVAGRYEEIVGDPVSEVGNFREFMRWAPAKDFGCRFRFPGEEGHTDALVRVLDHFLIKYGGKDPGAEDGGGGGRGAASLSSLRDEWSLGWLSTVLERMQDPHMDYEHALLGQYRVKAGRKSRNRDGDLLLPWSFDMPLTEGGMRLAFYGVDDPDDPGMLLEVPVEMYVPPKHVLLWR